MKFTVRQLSVLSLAFFTAVASGQSKVENPTETERPSETTAAQVEACLLIAREISQLTDRAKAADAVGDVDARNATVDPYNEAVDKWNAGCTRPYSKPDMIRAENRHGVRLCTLTRTPCLTEAQRSQILLDEKIRLARLRPKIDLHETEPAPSSPPPKAMLSKSKAVAPYPQKASSPGELLLASSSPESVPDVFAGVWNTSLEACVRDFSEGKLTVSASALEFGESRGEIRALTLTKGTVLTLIASMTARQEVWEQPFQYKLSEDSQSLTDTTGASSLVRIRCP